MSKQYPIGSQRGSYLKIEKLQGFGNILVSCSSFLFSLCEMYAFGDHPNDFFVFFQFLKEAFLEKLKFQLNGCYAHGNK